MQNKKTVIIGMIGLLIACVVLVVIVLLVQLANGNVVSNTTQPTSTPVSVPVNIIDLNNSSGGKFNYALIKSDDTIELRNSKNERFIIGLDKRKWKDIQWSPDGKLVSALGLSAGNIYDIYIYNIDKKEWSTATDFKNFPSGVDQYVWTDNNSILFTQGTTPNRWIHSYNYISKGILKVSNIVGDIVNISPDRKHLVVKAENSIPEIYNEEGIKVSSLGNIMDSETNTLLAIDTANFFNNSDEILATTTTGNFYKLNLGETLAIKTSLPKAYHLICSISDNSFLVYTFADAKLTFGSFNSRDDLLNILSDKDFNSETIINSNLSYCADNTAYLKAEFTDQSSKWYKESNTNITEDLILQDSIESAITNN